MKRIFMGAFMASLSLVSLAQTQLSTWLMDGKKLNFLTSVPTASTAFSTSASLHPGKNCWYDNQGNMQLHIRNGQLFNKYNNSVADLNIGSTTVTEFCIIPSPENGTNLCTKKFYIIVNHAQPLVGTMDYGIYDMNANGGNGSFTWVGNLGGSGAPQLAMAVSRVNANNERFLYIPNGFGELRIFRITATGISQVPSSPFTGYGVSAIGMEMELSNAGDKLAYSTYNSSTVSVLNLSGGLPSGTPYTFSLGANIYGAIGLEFDKAGGRLYCSTTGSGNGVAAGVYVKNLSQAANVLPIHISGTASFTGMLEKSYDGAMIICGNATQIRGINPGTQTLMPWPAVNYPGEYMPDQIDGENYSGDLLLLSGSKNVCTGKMGGLTITIPASLNLAGYVMEVKNLMTTVVTTHTPLHSQTFLYSPQSNTTYQVKLYHPNNPSCSITRTWSMTVSNCEVLRVDILTKGQQRLAFKGSSGNPDMEDQLDLQSSWTVQEMDPETNEPVYTINNPTCWQVPAHETLLFQGFDTDLDYASDASLFDCNPDITEGSFDENKNYLVTRTRWSNDYGIESGSVFIEKGVAINGEEYGKRASTGLFEPGSQGKVLFAIYPNPSKGIINIKADNNQAEHIEIFNITGMKVYEVSRSNGNTLSSLDVSALPKGIYIIKVQGGGETQVQRFILD